MIARITACLFLALASFAAAASSARAQEFERGKSIFAEQCANCHGDRGQGVAKHFDQPLVGDLSVRELSQVIWETMPEEKPKSLSNEDSLAVATFVHHEFYSSMAQLRNAPPKVELTHLTVDQFRQSVLDLMTPFTGQPERWKEERGLKRKIAQGNWGKDRKELETKVDSLLAFDWGDKPPIPEIDNERWEVRWDGSIQAPVTGWYEFYLDSTIRSNLRINYSDDPLIDASVVSFESTLNQASIYLLAGRSYHFSLDVSKFKEPKAKISLEWKIPGGVRQSIDARYLSPTWSPTALIVSTPFPPDDSSIGYERGRSVSREWYEATTAASIEIGNELTKNLKRWLPHDKKNPQDIELVKQWCYVWVSLALRHQLNDEEKQRYVNQHFENDSSIDRAIKRITLLAINSPHFQYPTVGLPADETIVSHLALNLWDSVPDKWMLEMAAKKECHEEAQIAGLVDRMIDDPRCREKIRGFFHEYLGVRFLKDLSKDTQRFPEFNERVAADLRTSFDMFIEDFATNTSGDVRQLLTADYMYANGTIAALYGLPLPADAPFQKVAVPREQRSGVLSHPYLMSGLAYHATSSPIHRGVFLAKRVLGRSLRPPVDAIIPVSEAAAPNMTTRERVAMQTSGAMCQTCHRIINPLGYSLEHYDAVGRFRAEELGKTVDASGQYVTSEGDQIQFRGVREMAEFLAGSNEVHQSIVRQLFQYLVKQPLAAYGLEKTATLDEQFAADGFALKPLVRRLMILSAQQVVEQHNAPAANATASTNN